MQKWSNVFFLKHMTYANPKVTNRTPRLFVSFEAQFYTASTTTNYLKAL